MTTFRIAGGVEHDPKSGRYHVLRATERGHGRARYCGRGTVVDANRIVVATADESEWCAKCLKEYRAWRLKYGYGPLLPAD